jgi:hypothetical protein
MQATHPDKKALREWLANRTAPEQEDPPPSLEEIRRQLGWFLRPGSGEEPEVIE